MTVSLAEANGISTDAAVALAFENALSYIAKPNNFLSGWQFEGVLSSHLILEKYNWLINVTFCFALCFLKPFLGVFSINS